jgi:hypothetical protein
MDDGCEYCGGEVVAERMNDRPHCQAPIQRREIRGRCEYALPCSHRLGQVGGDEVWP